MGSIGSRTKATKAIKEESHGFSHLLLYCIICMIIHTFTDSLLAWISNLLGKDSTGWSPILIIHEAT